jgi:hypothetical protein
MNLRGAKPVVDNSVRQFIESLNPSVDLYNEEIQHKFVDSFYNWIISSKLNNIQGLDDFLNRKLVAGTAQAFDHFYWRHKDRRFRFFEGEFMYHSAVLKHGGAFAYITEEEPIIPGDVVLLSVPFSDYGTVHTETEVILEMCEHSGVPVLLDFAYYPCTKNITLDLDNYMCVTTVTFSISKAFYGAEFLRVGMRLERFDLDDGIDVFNSVEMVNRVSLSIASKLIEKYSVDHNWNTYSNVYSQVCKKHNLKETDCIMFGLGGDEYAEYNRGTEVNRVCISELIGEEINGSSK